MTAADGAPNEQVWAYPGAELGRSIIARVRERALSHGSDPFLTAVASDGRPATLTYAELDRDSSRLAGWLRRELGIHPGAVVGMIPRNDVASAVAVFGIVRAGCAALMLSPSDPTGRLRTQVRAARVRHVLRSPVTSPDHYPEATEVPLGRELPHILAGSGDAPLEPGGDALLFGTSGSTAVSKLVVQSHRNLMANAEAVRRHHRLARGVRILGCLPLHHVNGLHFTVLGAAWAGAHSLLAPGYQRSVYRALLERSGAHLASVVPPVLEAILSSRRLPRLPSEFRYFVSAAAPLLRRTVRDVSRTLGVRVIQGYGLTETTNFSLTMPADLHPQSYDAFATSADIPSVGSAVYGNEVAILHEDGSAAPPGTVGEICMRGSNVMSRYAGNQAATAEAFRFGWFHSQDLGYAIDDPVSRRRLFTITGRTKNIAKVGGETVSLEEMERVLRSLPEVHDAACTTVLDRLRGEEIVVAVVFAAGSSADLRQALRPCFSEVLLPRRVLAVDSIPRAATGKVLRPQLRETVTAILNGGPVAQLDSSSEPV